MLEHAVGVPGLEQPLFDQRGDLVVLGTRARCGGDDARETVAEAREARDPSRVDVGRAAARPVSWWARATVSAISRSASKRCRPASASSALTPAIRTFSVAELAPAGRAATRRWSGSTASSGKPASRKAPPRCQDLRRRGRSRRPPCARATRPRGPWHGPRPPRARRATPRGRAPSRDRGPDCSTRSRERGRTAARACSRSAAPRPRPGAGGRARRTSGSRATVDRGPTVQAPSHDHIRGQPVARIPPRRLPGRSIADLIVACAVAGRLPGRGPTTRHSVFALSTVQVVGLSVSDGLSFVLSTVAEPLRVSNRILPTAPPPPAA